MTINKNLTIIVVSYNSGDVISRCLYALLEASPCKIVIIDNASTDNTVIFLRERFPDIEIIESKYNVGYGRAANLGLKKVSTKYCLLLNPDVFLNVKTLSLIFKEVLVCEQNIAVFSPALTKQEFSKKGNVAVDYLIGAFLLFNMDCLKQVGFFDENIFLFYEEKDLEFRAIKQGYRLVLMSDYYVEHIKSASTKKSKAIDSLRNWHVAWSSLYYAYKHGFMTNKYQGVALMLKYGLKCLVNLESWKRKKYKARFLGCAAYLRGEKSFVNGVAQYSDRINYRNAD